MFGFKKNEIRNEEERKQRELGLDKINPKIRKTKKLSVGKTIAIAATIFILAIAVIIAIVLLNTKNNQLNKENQVRDPELARAMTYGQFQDGDDAVYAVDEDGNITETIVDNIKFSSFFPEDIDNDGYINQMKGTCKSIDKTPKVIMELKVQTDGYLKDGLISINANNCEYSVVLVEDEVVGENIAGFCNKIKLNPRINAGTQKIIDNGSISSCISPNVNSLSGVNQIILTGVFVDENDNEIPIKKVINLQVDWYGSVKTVVNQEYNSKKDYSSQKRYIDNILEDNQVKVNFILAAAETK